MKHKTNAYKDGYKWIIFCIVCGVEEPDLNLNGKCSGELRLREQEELFGQHDTKIIRGELSPSNLSIGEAIEKGKNFLKKPIVVGNSQTGKN